MKSLSGANPESKPDYRQQALTELNKLESKVILLNEMLDNVDATRGERFVVGDVYDVRPASPIEHWMVFLMPLITMSTASWFLAFWCASKNPEMDLRCRIPRSGITR